VASNRHRSPPEYFFDDRHYRGPIVAELDPPYRTPAVIGETVDYLRGRY